MQELWGLVSFRVFFAECCCLTAAKHGGVSRIPCFGTLHYLLCTLPDHDDHEVAHGMWCSVNFLHAPYSAQINKLNTRATPLCRVQDAMVPPPCCKLPATSSTRWLLKFSQNVHNLLCPQAVYQVGDLVVSPDGAHVMREWHMQWEEDVLPALCHELQHLADELRDKARGHRAVMLLGEVGAAL